MFSFFFFSKESKLQRKGKRGGEWRGVGSNGKRGEQRRRVGSRGKRGGERQRGCKTKGENENSEGRKEQLGKMNGYDCFEL
jgi:hypothetical protein